MTQLFHHMSRWDYNVEGIILNQMFEYVHFFIEDEYE